MHVSFFWQYRLESKSSSLISMPRTQIWWWTRQRSQTVTDQIINQGVFLQGAKSEQSHPVQPVVNPGKPACSRPRKVEINLVPLSRKLKPPVPLLKTKVQFNSITYRYVKAEPPPMVHILQHVRDADPDDQKVELNRIIQQHRVVTWYAYEQVCLQMYSDPSYFYQQWLNDMVAMVSIGHKLKYIFGSELFNRRISASIVCFDRNFLCVSLIFSYTFQSSF